MIERRHYAKAPIVEALIDLRFVLPDEITLEHFAEIRKAVKTDYPNETSVFKNNIEFQIGENPGAKNEQQNIGYRFVHRDKLYIFQPRLDGFTFSVLHPYDNWEVFRDEAKRLWDIFCSFLPVSEVSRIAVRYINRIDIPISNAPIEVKDYLKTYIEVSPNYPYDSLDNFFAQIQVPQPDLEAMLVLNQTRTAPPHEEIVSVILDLDLFSERSTKPWKISDQNELWGFLEKLHTRKNEIFIGSITQKTEEMIS